MIGVVGGMGPYAGLNLVQKIFDETDAKTDQDHIPVSMLSIPHSIADRTEFLTGESPENPAIAISKVIHKLYAQGATVIGMPCNTAHADPIFNEILNHIPTEIKFIHMIRQVANFLKNEYPSFKKIGVLSTAGTSISNVYQNALARYGLTELKVSSEIQNSTIDPAIYSKTYGVKAFSNPVTEQAKNDLSSGIDHLINNGADIEHQNNEGQTAAMKAVKGNRYYVLKIFLDQNIDLNLSDYSGRTIKDMVKQSRDKRILKMLN